MGILSTDDLINGRNCFSSWRAPSAFLYSCTLFSAGDSGGVGLSRSPKNSVAADLSESREDLLDRDGGRLGSVSEFPKSSVVVDLFESWEDLMTLRSGCSDCDASLTDTMLLSLV